MADALDFWIYRDRREARCGARALAELIELVVAVGLAAGDRARRLAVDAVVACGEIEAALADAGERVAAAVAEETDRLAGAALGARYDARAAAARLSALVVPPVVRVSTAEGFAYYALHPEAYARVARERAVCPGGVLVVGVRSIGTTLSAVACAALAARGERASRITVRPSGDPYDRRLELDAAQREAVQRATERGGEILVVDEGPGDSGSTFLAAAEAIACAGMPAHRITLAFSHRPLPESLAARDAPARFRRFPIVVAPPAMRAPPARADLSAGAWRGHVYPCGEAAWPASFTQTERRKLLLDDGRLAKFEGLGRFGRAALARAAALADAGFSAPPRDEGDGWLSYEWAGSPLSHADLDSRIIDRIAAYCAARPLVCPTAAPTPNLYAMVAKNLSVGLARADVPDLRYFARALRVERAAVVDGRMSPHEWLRARDGRLWKSDGIGHGDDHFFPGPTDIAWDLAGVIVEWGLDDRAAERLLSAYHQISNDDPRPRIKAWMLTYAAFRLAFASVGVAKARGTSVERRLARDAERYRAFAS